MAKKPKSPTEITSIRHKKDTRVNIPTEELRDFVAEDEQAPKAMLYPRDPSLDPQLVWKGKDEQDAEALEGPVVPIYIQEKVHPQALVENLRITARRASLRNMAEKALRLDEIGYWSEVKLDIVKKYASAYSIIMAKQPSIKRHIYIDAFAGAGQHISKATGDFVPGSPLNALAIKPPFKELHLIDLDGEKVGELRKRTAGVKRVTVHQGDCNDVLLSEVFPRCQYADYHRALCLLDPYGLSVNWEVLRTAGNMKSVDVFYNFMIMDANMNVFMRDPSKVAPEQAARMDAVWGDGSWRTAAYRKREDLFGQVEEKATNDDIAHAFRERLKTAAGFVYVPNPMPMRNSRGAVVYYLYFATPKAVAANIVSDIFDKYRDKGAT